MSDNMFGGENIEQPQEEVEMTVNDYADLVLEARNPSSPEPLETTVRLTLLKNGVPKEDLDRVTGEVLERLGDIALRKIRSIVNRRELAKRQDKPVNSAQDAFDRWQRENDK
jgi:hypothetical protein